MHLPQSEAIKVRSTACSSHSAFLEIEALRVSKKPLKVFTETHSVLVPSYFFVFFLEITK